MEFQQPYSSYMDSSMMMARMNTGHASMEHTAGSEYIDPGLKCYPTSSHVMGSWDTDMFYPPFHECGLKDTIPPLPTPVPFRQTASSGYSSSICSSALSPKESDYGRGHSPSTPSDEISAPQFQFSHDSWDSQSQSQLLHFTGMAEGCVKPDDVNLYQDSLPSYPGEERDVELPFRGYSMSSNGSGFDHDWQVQSAQLQSMRTTSPTASTPVIQDEIRVPDVTFQQSYPPYETDEEEGGPADGVAANPIKDDDDEDDTYAPYSRHQHAGSSKQRGARGKKRPSTSQPAPSKKIKLEPNSPAHATGRAGLACPECPDASFKDVTGLQNHIKKQHTRPFTCVFGFAGCESTFAAKNEWKRHVASQHLLLNYWLCCQGACANISNATPSTAHVFASHGAAAPALPNGAIFNRKDLYTQHVRRMHVPPSLKKQFKQKKTVQEWEERIQTLQSEAHKLRCDLPKYMVCPAARCNTQFQGANAWDERMEHVAKHLEKAAAGHEEPIVFGGHSDQTLTLWAARPDVAVVVPSGRGAWAMNNPLRPDRASRARVQPVVKRDDDDGGDEDAEGEEVDE